MVSHSQKNSSFQSCYAVGTFRLCRQWDIIYLNHLTTFQITKIFFDISNDYIKMATRSKIPSKIKYIIGLCHKKRLMLFPWSFKGITSKMPWLMDSADGKAGERGCIFTALWRWNTHIPWWSLSFKQGNRILEMWLSCRQAVECFDSILLEWLEITSLWFSYQG